MKQSKTSNEEDLGVPVSSPKPIPAAKAYEKAGFSKEPENFDEEFEDADQVKVTLSENVKILKELQGEKNDEVSNESFEEKSDLQKIDEVQIKNEIGAGEEALELLTKKHQALKKQNEEESLKEQVEEENDDLFADELIPLTEGEAHIENEKDKFTEDEIFSPQIDSESYEDDDGLELSLRQSTTHAEKFEEAKGLLKLATSACEAGRMEEAKAGLNSYLKLLHELGQSPSKNVLQLAKKLEITFDDVSVKTHRTENEELSDAADIKIENENQKENLKTDYSTVMDEIVKTLEKKEAYDEALPLLKDLLKFNRDRVNISAMDPLFERIEKAHSSLNNNEELVETYKEHLAIKQQLEDIEGELSLLDIISKHYANSGDQKASERYSTGK